MEKHVQFMKMAHDMAFEAQQVGEIPIGCVIVHENKVIGGGRNKTNETRNVRVHLLLG